MCNLEGQHSQTANDDFYGEKKPVRHCERSEAIQKKADTLKSEGYSKDPISTAATRPPGDAVFLDFFHQPIT